MGELTCGGGERALGKFYRDATKILPSLPPPLSLFSYSLKWRKRNFAQKLNKKMLGLID